MAQLKAGSTVGGVAILTKLKPSNLNLSGGEADKFLGTDDLQNIVWFDKLWTYGGTIAGFVPAGWNNSMPLRIDRFPFSAPFATSTNVGSVVVAGGYGTGQSSDTHGYISGGIVPDGSVNLNSIQRFTFSTSPITVSDLADLSQARRFAAGHSSNSQGWTSGGQGPTNRIDKFPFSTPFTTATDAGDLSLSRGFMNGGHSSETHGFVSGGATLGSPPVFHDIIDKFPFSSPFVTSTDIANLSLARSQSSGQSSSTDAYVSGGGAGPAGPQSIVDKFPFSAPFVTSTVVGNLVQARFDNCGNSSETHGFSSGGFTPPYTNTVDRFPFSAPFTTATDIGNLSQSRKVGANGQNY